MYIPETGARQIKKERFMINSISAFMQSVRPVADEVATALSHGAEWMGRVVNDLTRDLPPNVAPIARVGLLAVPFIAFTAVMPLWVTVVTLGAGAAVGFVASRSLAT
jgi:hypothetical protein